MKNIVLAGLPYSTNLGDVAIFRNTRKIVEDYCKDKGLNYEIRELDIHGDYRFAGFSPLHVLYERAFRKINSTLHKKDEYRFHTMKHFCNEFIDRNTAAVIFTGGGIIKYRYQLEFCRSIDVITRRADRLDIPVMFSAVGVEGYDGSDENCLKLKASINRNCVKKITVRDDLQSLERYMESDRIEKYNVADPAVLTDQLIPAVHNEHSGIIGLGIVREKLFTDNDIDFHKEQLMELYKDLWFRIKSEGYGCKVFVNGIISDNKMCQEFKVMMKERYNEDVEVLPRVDDLDDLIGQITSFEAVICSRLHSSILSYAYGVVSVAIVWNNKQNLFGQNIGYPERFISVEEASADLIWQRLLKAMKEGYEKIDRQAYGRTTAAAIGEFLDTVLK